jgi:hypothetical protein
MEPQCTQLEVFILECRNTKNNGMSIIYEQNRELRDIETTCKEMGGFVTRRTGPDTRL